MTVKELTEQLDGIADDAEVLVWGERGQLKVATIDYDFGVKTVQSDSGVRVVSKALTFS